jgi:glycosyltransferase involved in cell wall biosynthesis
MKGGAPARGRLDHPVGIVHDWLTGQRGGENVLRAICRLFPGAPVYTLFHFPGSVDAEIESHPIVTSFLDRAPGIDPRYRSFLPLFPLAIEDLPTSGHRYLISTSHCVAKGARRGPDAFHLCYCHTPMRYAWDQIEAYFGRDRGVVRRLRRAVLAALRRWDVATVGRVDRFLANSSFVADRIRRFYGRPAEVLPPPVDTDFFTPPPAGDAPERRYALMVASLSPYKKVDLAIEACRLAGLPLVVVGDGPERPALARIAGPDVTFAGRVGGERLRDAYRGALCFLQPGIEDFGIATVEALACGTPVVALGHGGVLDIVREGREGVFFRHDEPREIADAVDKCRRMAFNSVDFRERAAGFSTASFARRFGALVAEDWPDAEEFLA